MKKFNLKVFTLICILPMLGIASMTWGHMNIVSLLFMTILLAVGTSRVYCSICKSLKKGH